MPEGESVITKDQQKTLLTQNEQSRICSALERAGAIGKGTPFSPKAQDILRAEYDYAMDVGGPRGAAIARAMVDIVRENGGDIHGVVDHHRRPHHHRALQDADNDRAGTNLVGRRVDEPPFPKPGAGGGKRTGTYGRGGKKLFSDNRKPAFTPSKRRPSWK